MEHPHPHDHDHPVQPSMMLPHHPQGQAMIPQGDLANSYYHEGPHDLSGGLPINLDSLRDGPPGSKPFYPYSTLIRYAIKGSPTGKLLLEDIYYAIESRFPYFRSAPSGWKNSVRHNLSLNPCFVKVARPLTDRGKGSYWTVDDNVDPRTGVHRIRKKGASKKKKPSDDAVEEAGSPPDFTAPPYAQPPPGFEEHYHAGPLDGRPPFEMPYNTFDPAFPMLPPGMRFPPLPPPVPEFEFDGAGNVDWPATWRKELAALARETEAHGGDEEWCRQTLMRVRGVAPVFIAPPPPAGPEGIVPAHTVGGTPEEDEESDELLDER